MLKDIEKANAFFLGKEIGDKEPLMYESKNLTTHAVCLGMTGSGKTGLGIALLEEAGIDKIPAIIIDPKGDLADLLLTFPDLSAAEFKPWVDKDEDPEVVAKKWKEGLAKWGEGSDKIKLLKSHVDMQIYTPASRAGTPISILSSLNAPSQEIRNDPQAMRERVLTVTSSLLGLLGISADPIKSREHILISTLIDQSWSKGDNLDIATLIEQVQKPPFETIGALDIDTFLPAKERTSLSISLNSLLASPGFQAWMDGEPLDIQSLLYAKSGKPKLSILSIAHLSDPERMFFVTLLLNEVISWMRRQPGSSDLKALLYMDEIFGYFPPNGMPPSKMPMLTLLKQARAFGLGIILATQNPVDLDYKGLSNCGTWFIGKLQTDRDKSKVMEGLNDPSLKNQLDKLGNRIFLMHSVHEKKAILFETRWTLSYLRGPLTLSQIATLTTDQPRIFENRSAPAATSYEQLYINDQNATHYQPKLIAFAKLHFVDSKYKIDVWNDLSFISDLEGDSWMPVVNLQIDNEGNKNAHFDDLPPFNMQKAEKKLIEFLLTTQTFDCKKKIEEKYAPKLAILQQKLKDAQDKTESRKTNALISFGTAILGAIVGKKLTKGTLSSASSSIQKYGKDDSSTSIELQIQNLQEEMQREIASIQIKPKKSDLSIEKIALLWQPTSSA